MWRRTSRQEAVCPYFQRCGGCHYQHISYERQLEYKTGILRETLQRIAKIELMAEIELHPSPPWNYRNRTRLRVQTEPEFALGYNRFGSHEFLAVQECPISSPLINRVIARLLALKGASVRREWQRLSCLPMPPMSVCWHGRSAAGTLTGRIWSVGQSPCEGRYPQSRD